MINHGGEAILSQNTKLANNTSAYIKFVGTSSISISGLSSGSDRRLKYDINPISGVLDKIEQFNAVKFRYNEEELDRIHYGVIAQDIVDLFPEVVYTDGDGLYLVNYQELTTAVSISGIKELHSLLKSQSEMIQSLAERIEALEQKGGSAETV